MATTAPTPSPVAALPAASWSIDPIHSHAGFEVKHLGISTFRGRFTDAGGTIRTEPGRVVAVEGRVGLASIQTNDERPTAHLRSPDFLDVENHPEGRFVSTAIAQEGDGLVIDGELTLRGVTRPVRLRGAVEGWGVDPAGAERIAIQARGEIDRTEYGISWNATLENGLQAVGERVVLVLGVDAVREAAQ